MNPAVFSGELPREVARWLGNFLPLHAKREDPRVEVVLDAGDAREGRSYGVRLRSARAPSAARRLPIEFDFSDVADDRGTLRLVRGARRAIRARARALGPRGLPRATGARRGDLGAGRALIAPDPATRSGRWYAPGDVNGFLGLALDNVTNLVILAGLLDRRLRVPRRPGARTGWSPARRWASWSATSATPGWRCACARKTGRDDVTAMPFGIDTPSLFAHHLRRARARRCSPPATRCSPGRWAWATTIAIGLAKLGLAFAGDWVRRVVPRAGAARLDRRRVDAAHRLPADAQDRRATRWSGFVSLGLILVALVGRIADAGPGARARWRRCWRAAPSTRGALAGIGPAGARADRARGLAPGGAVADARLARRASARRWAAPVDRAPVRPGDRHRRHRQHGERDRGGGRLPDPGHPADRGRWRPSSPAWPAAWCRTRPYIGHPAYKAMGARAGYTLATGLVIGVGAMAGVVSILVGDRARGRGGAHPRLHRARDHRAGLPRHAGASRARRRACVHPDDGRPGADPARRHPREPRSRRRRDPGEAAATIQTLRLLGNGFILTALLWGAAAGMIIDRRLLAAAATLAVASLASLCGVIHSPSNREASSGPARRHPSGRGFSPGDTGSSRGCWSC